MPADAEAGAAQEHTVHSETDAGEAGSETETPAAHSRAFARLAAHEQLLAANIRNRVVSATALYVPFAALLFA
jgi:hypothetical protein